VDRLDLTHQMKNPSIVKEKTTMELMKALLNMYEKLSMINKIYLMQRLFHLKMGEGMSVAKHINKFNDVINQLSLIAINFENEECALTLLSSLLDIWNTTITTVSNFSRSRSLTFDKICNFILSENMRRKEFGEHVLAILLGESR